MAGTESTPVWVADEEVEKCSSCKAVFSLLKRRHHCRKCGLIFCADCSSNKLQLPKYGYGNPVRVCDNCYQDQTQGVISG